MAFRASRLSFVILPAWLSACGSAHDVGSPTVQHDRAGTDAATLAAPVASTALCARLASAQCMAEQRCCTAKGRALDACKSARMSECEDASHLDTIAVDPLTGFDRAAAENVFTQLETKLEACDPDVVRWSASQAGLRSLFKGSVPRGQSCKPAQAISANESQQTAALLSCLDAPQTACMPESLLGQWTCTSKSARAGSCLTDDNCETDSYCATPEQAIFGTCTGRLTLAAACSTTTQCQSFNCSHGSCSEPDPQAAFCPGTDG